MIGSEKEWRGKGGAANKGVKGRKRRTREEKKREKEEEKRKKM